MSDEVWKEISHEKIPKGLYSVSDHGRVRNNDSGKILKQSIDYDDYHLVTLSIRDGKGGHKTFRVNRLVALAFIENPSDKPIVNHLNSNRRDNMLSNLEWATSKENTQHGLKKGNFRGINRKYSMELFHKICSLLVKGHKPKEIRAILNLNDQEYYFLLDIKARRVWKDELKMYDFENGKTYLSFEKSKD